MHHRWCVPLPSYLQSYRVSYATSMTNTHDTHGTTLYGPHVNTAALQPFNGTKNNETPAVHTTPLPTTPKGGTPWGNTATRAPPTRMRIQLREEWRYDERCRRVKAGELSGSRQRCPEMKCDRGSNQMLSGSRHEMFRSVSDRGRITTLHVATGEPQCVAPCSAATTAGIWPPPTKYAPPEILAYVSKHVGPHCDAAFAYSPRPACRRQGAYPSTPQAQA